MREGPIAPDEKGSKTLIVYVEGSFFRYYELYKEHLYELKDGDLLVYCREQVSGEEWLTARFRNWNYFTVD
jgi:hypothetical protein